MVKYLLLVVVLYLIYRVFRRPTRERPAPRAEDPQAMVKCARCGVHIPLSEAVDADGVPYCSDAHRLQGPRKAP